MSAPSKAHSRLRLALASDALTRAYARTEPRRFSCATLVMPTPASIAADIGPRPGSSAIACWFMGLRLFLPKNTALLGRATAPAALRFRGCLAHADRRMFCWRANGAVTRPVERRVRLHLRPEEAVTSQDARPFVFATSGQPSAASVLVQPALSEDYGDWEG